MEKNKGAASGNNKGEGGSRKRNYSDDQSSNPVEPSPYKIAKTDIKTLDYFSEYDSQEEECAKDSSESEEDNPKEEPTEAGRKCAEAKELAKKVRDELYTFKMKSETTLADHLSALEGRFVHLAELGSPLDSKTCNGIIMRSLPLHWTSLLRKTHPGDTTGLSAHGLYDLLLSLEP